MKTLTYSTSKYSELNSARRDLWVCKDLLGASNTTPEISRSYWMGELNRSRANLRKVARKVRAQLAEQQARAGK